MRVPLVWKFFFLRLQYYIALYMQTDKLKKKTFSTFAYTKTSLHNCSINYFVVYLTFVLLALKGYKAIKRT